MIGAKRKMMSRSDHIMALTQKKGDKELEKDSLTYQHNTHSPVASTSNNKLRMTRTLPEPDLHVPEQHGFPVEPDGGVNAEEFPTDITKEEVLVVNAIYHRYVNFNEHPEIFDFGNEYQNSLDYVKSNDLSDLTKILLEKESIINESLICYETLPRSDDEDEIIRIQNQVALFEDSDDSIKDKDYVPDSENTTTDCEDEDEHTKIKETGNLQNTKNCSTIIQEINLALVSHENSMSILNEPINPTLPLHPTTERLNLTEPLNPTSSVTEDGKGLTKAGLPRKRRVIEGSLAERKNRKKQLQAEKLSLKSACSESCRRQCSSLFQEDERKCINDQFTKLDKVSQGVFIKSMVDTKNVQNRKQTGKKSPKRKVTYAYFLKNQADIRKEVCKTFFLSTLGYHPKNDQRVLAALKRPIDKQSDRRGTYERTNKIDRNIIKDHVFSYNPAVSHYRREHAPNKLYLPSDISVTLMFKNFREKYPTMQISQETYRTVVKNDLNISFTHLGNEECETCTIFKLHNTEHVENLNDSCDICKNYTVHKKRYTESRIKYQDDVEKAVIDKTTIRYSVDLQKVVMLPRIDQFKAAIFCPRIIAFNESFVPLGKTSKEDVPFAALWNESVSGRHQQDIISTFRAFLTHKRDAENVIFWVDNCASQNKNWALLSFLVDMVNSSLITAKSIELRYFEPGHTFMSADHFHHQVEKMLGKRKVYDYDDYIGRVKMANNGKNIVKLMDVSDFYSYEDLSSQHKLRNKEPRIYLKDIMVVKAERGQWDLKYKTGHNEEYEILDFLQMKIKKTQKFPEVLSKKHPRGITEERKAEILEKLVPLMPENRKIFWRNIPVCNSATNLLAEEW